MENWKRFLDDCEILLKTDLIKPDDLLTILNSVNNEIQYSVELNDNKLPFLDIVITKSGKKIRMNIYSKQTDSKRYVSYYSNDPKPCLKNIPFCLTRLHDSRKQNCLIHEAYGTKNNFENSEISKNGC